VRKSRNDLGASVLLTVRAVVASDTIANAISCAYRALIAFALASRLGLGLGLAASLLRRFFALATPY
jgi:ABC-type nitrate/sulfonate/bicarbonate transport system permease component